MAQFALPLLLLVLGPLYIRGVANASPTFNLVNSCQDTIWPAIYTSEEYTNNLSMGFALGAGYSKTITAPDSWFGSIWARTHCSEDSGGNFSCLTGDCGSGKVDCAGGRGASPVTQAEFRIYSWGNSFYDVTLVDGFNLPMLVDPLGSGDDCTSTGCTADLIRTCPSELKMTNDRGKTLACKSPCEAFKTDEYCCPWSSTCNPSNYSEIFKKACPNALSQPGDNTNTSFHCSGWVFTITFCPATNSSHAPSYLPVNAASILRAGDQLNSSSQLVSEGGNFTLGFFTIPETNLSYLGIWYTADNNQRKVWVYNANSLGNDAQLTMDSTGNLILFSGENPVINFNSTEVVTNNNTIAVLLDSGNFVLMDSRAGNRTLWQSFDHPTNTLLPGMKLGFNLTTRQNWTLTSWLSSDIPALGAFEMSLERTPDSVELVIRMHGRAYWTSGPWNNQGFPLLSSLNDPSNLFFYKLDFVSDNNGMYINFRTTGTLAMLTLSPDGNIIDGENRIMTPFAKFCYGYEKDNGCVTSAKPICRSNEDMFEFKSGGFIGGDIHSDQDSSLSLSDCMERCWNNCYCNGFVTNNNGTGCITWTGTTLFQVDESGSAVRTYVLVTRKSSKGKTWIWMVIVVSVIILMLLGFVCFIKIKKHKAKENERRLRDEYIHQLTKADSFKTVSKMQKIRREGDLNILSFSSVMAATNDFSVENKLGEGGFGPVYRGKLLDGREVAVKRLSRSSGQGLVEFKNELIFISKLQHTNLVRVLGSCINEEEKMLIYEYMPNKSLDFFLFAEDKKGELDWQKRFNIIEGVAQGLLYLHKYSRMRVIHRDLKASNVLLDENMNPKIADFGMAKIFKPNETEASTNRVVGTYGYMSPEYAMEGTFSTKSDVFSFGVLILEIVSGKRNSSFHEFDNDRPLNLIGYAWGHWREGTALELKDLVLGDSYNTKLLLRSIHVGLLCVQESAIDRPTVSEVISMLNNENMDLPDPKQPAFFTAGRALNRDSTSSRGNQGKKIPVSVNDMTISEIEAR